MATLAAIIQQIRDMLNSANDFDRKTIDAAGIHLTYCPLEQLVTVLFRATNTSTARLALSNIMRHGIAVVQDYMRSPLHDLLWHTVEVFEDCLPVPEAKEERAVAIFKEALSGIVPIGYEWCTTIEDIWTFPTAAELQQALETGSLRTSRVDVMRAAVCAVNFTWAQAYTRTKDELRVIEKLLGEGGGEQAQQGSEVLTQACDH